MCKYIRYIINIMSEEIQLKKSKDIDIKVHLIEKFDFDGLHESWMKFSLEGKDMNNKLVNAIRRSSMVNVPSYAFPPELIHIEENNCEAFNNDYMRLRLSLLPLFNIDTDLYYLDEKYYSLKYNDPLRIKHPKEKHVEVYISGTNTTTDIISLTTNNVKVYVDEELVQMYNKDHPILLIKLRPNDKFKCLLRGAIGIGDHNGIWNLSNNSFYKEIEAPETSESETSTKSYEFTVESNGQINERDIIVKSCKYLIHRLQIVKNQIATYEKTKEKNVEIQLDNEDHTIGELLNYEIQSNEDIIFSGMKKPDCLVKSINITCCSKTKRIIDIIDESVVSLIEKLSHLGKCFESLKL